MLVGAYVPGHGRNVAIMQPYFFPYIGYFQLIAAVDLFIIHDRVKYTKKGWINRNRILVQGQDAVISLPLRADPDALDIVDRRIAADFRRDKFLNRVGEAYRRAPYFQDAYALVERVIQCDDPNLFGFLRNSIENTCRYLGLGTKMVAASSLDIDPSMTGQDKVIALCRKAEATTYINAIGGMELYSAEPFRAADIELRFIRSRPVEYAQFGAPFVPWLSIIDAMMFNSVETIQRHLTQGYDLIPPMR
jgi:hypothetical protein